MATITKMREEKRSAVVNQLVEFFSNYDVDVLKVKSNAIAFPIVLEDGTEDFIKIVVSIPKGTKEEPYDGYAEAEDYKFHLQEMEMKKQKNMEKKKAKIERDKKMREKRKEIHNKD